MMGRQDCNPFHEERENTVCWSVGLLVCWSVVIHTVKGFGVVDEAEVDAFSGILLLFL